MSIDTGSFSEQENAAFLAGHESMSDPEPEPDESETLPPDEALVVAAAEKAIAAERAELARKKMIDTLRQKIKLNKGAVAGAAKVAGVGLGVGAAGGVMVAKAGWLWTKFQNLFHYGILYKAGESVLGQIDQAVSEWLHVPAASSRSKEKPVSKKRN